jgi:hypothetical protein
MVQASPLVQFLIVAFAAWLARQQEAFIEYLKTENAPRSSADHLHRR